MKTSEPEFAGWLGKIDGRPTVIWSGSGAVDEPDTEELDIPFEEIFLRMASRGYVIEPELTHGMRRIFRA